MDPILILLYIYAFFFIFFGVWSMFAIAADKNAAETRQWRTSEYKLHLLELMGDGSGVSQLNFLSVTKSRKFLIRSFSGQLSSFMWLELWRCTSTRNISGNCLKTYKQNQCRFWSLGEIVILQTRNYLKKIISDFHVFVLS